MTIYAGRFGKIELSREFPAPVILPGSALGGSYLTVNAEGWVPTDAVLLVYETGGGSITSLSGFFYRDELDRVYIHTTREGALNNEVATRVSLAGVTANPMIFASLGTGSQTSTLVAFLDGLASPPSTETSLQAYPSTFNSYQAGGTSTTGWVVQGLIEKYRFNTSGNTVDVGALGNYFGESIKTAISGDGTLDFYINLFSDTTQADPDALLRMSLMLDQGARARAKFYLREPRQLEPYGTRTPFIGALFYEATILFTDTVLDCNAGDVLSGSSDFVSVGPIRLRTELP